MRLLLVCSLVFCTQIWGKILTYDELNAAPKGIAKDYYIYRYVKESNHTKEEIQTLKPQIYRYSGKLKIAVESVIGAPEPTCTKDFLKESLSCQKSLLSVDKLNSLNKKQRKSLANKFKEDQDVRKFILNHDMINPVSQAIKGMNLYAYHKYYVSSGDKNKFLNAYKLPTDFINQILQKSWFKDVVNKVVYENKFDNFGSNLLDANASNLDFDTTFALGLNAIKLNKDDKAIEFFRQSSAKAPLIGQKDMADFWVYLISKDQEILDQLSKSNDANIYSIYARELNGDQKIKIAIPNPLRNKLNNYDKKDPFAWQLIKEKAKHLSKQELIEFAKDFYTKDTMGEYSYLMEKAQNYQIPYFPMPFLEHIEAKSIERKALILALARQESRFIPSAVSSSYAIGMMQFMPFLAHHIAKNDFKMSNFEQDAMFDPIISYKFANAHLDYLEKYLTNPIFIGYAYNGGIGFTRRMLNSGHLFNDKNDLKYEPFLSMELVPYAESREYAKRVLANYVVYLSILRSNTKISHFFSELMIPGQGERFRVLRVKAD